MGAWIEIILFINSGSFTAVAPYMGAWIEILPRSDTISYVTVAPYMGAWIEIDRKRLPS